MKSNEFNKKYKVGSRVKYFPIIGEDKFVESKTRSEAWELGSGHTVVKIDGKTGGVSLYAIEVNCASEALQPKEKHDGETSQV